MDYNQIMNFIKNTEKFGSKPGLTRIQKLADLLGNPQDSLSMIHIAGTNGKGSTASFLSHILRQAGYRVGLYTSPFVYHFNERIRINNENITDSDLVDVVSEVKEAVDKMILLGEEHPTEFEIITTAAFLYFQKQKCDVVILEVGLGGRFDATNIIQKPLLSIITSISMDHMEYLGNTIEQIAFEKCGIIKEGGITVSYAQQNDMAKQVIAQIAKERNNKLLQCDSQSLVIKKCDLEGSIFDYGDFSDVKLQMLGEYQIYNAITAINASKILQELGYHITKQNVLDGLLQNKWWGRFEIIGQNPLFIVDGSHNLDGVHAFVKTAQKSLEHKQIICIMGMLKDKEYKECIRMISKVADVFIATNVANPRSAEASVLAEVAKEYLKDVYCIKDNKKAVEKAYSLAKEEDVIVSVGSLYMISEIKKNIKTA